MNIGILYTPQNEAELVVSRIKNGENNLRDSLISTYKVYVASIVSRIIHAGAIGRDEFSVALEAFNEAIDRYDRNKSTSFLAFSELVINRRVIEYLRSTISHSVEYPFSYFDVYDNENIIDRLESENPSFHMERIEIKEEILEFKSRLADYGITFDDLVNLSPKHLDAKLLCISIAKRINSVPKLVDMLENNGRLPIAELMTNFKVSRKTFEKHRNYIIALYIVISGNMEIIKGYIKFTSERMA